MRPYGLDTTDRTLIPYYVDSNTICLNYLGSSNNAQATPDARDIEDILEMYDNDYCWRRKGNKCNLVKVEVLIMRDITALGGLIKDMQCFGFSWKKVCQNMQKPKAASIQSSLKQLHLSPRLCLHTAAT